MENRLNYLLGNVEEAIYEMELDEEAEIIEMEDDYQIIVSGWYVYIPDLSLKFRAGVVSNWDEEEQEYLPDFAVTVIYEEDSEGSDYLYYEQDEMIISLANWLNARVPLEEIQKLQCELCYGIAEDDD